MAMLPVNFVVGVLCALMCAACAWAGEVIPVTQTGAKPGDGADDTAGVRAAIRLCRSKPGSVLRFPKGRYDFHPPEGPPARPVAMHFAGCKDLTVEGEGSELVFHGTMGAMAFNECRGVVVRNVVIDSQRPPFSIGEVIAAAGKSFDVEVWKEFPVRGGEAVEAFMEYDPETKFPMPGGLDVYHAVDSTELLRPQVLRVQLKRAVRAKVGAVMVLRHVVYGPGALAFRSSADVRVENVTIYATPGMGVTGSQSTDLHLKAVRVMNRPGTRRIMSATADATHFNACCGSIRIEDCLFEGMGDDAVNVHGMYLRVTQRLDDKTILAVVRNNWLFPPQPGHNLELIDPASLLPYDTGCVEAVSVDRRAGTHRITFARPLPQRLQAGHYLGNTAWAPKLRITGCQVRANRARGFLIQTRDALGVHRHARRRHPQQHLRGMQQRCRLAPGRHQRLRRPGAGQGPGRGGRAPQRTHRGQHHPRHQQRRHLHLLGRRGRRAEQSHRGQQRQARPHRRPLGRLPAKQPQRGDHRQHAGGRAGADPGGPDRPRLREGHHQSPREQGLLTTPPEA
ncbi:MAG: hypothetical protein AMJ81_09600 [Phycisphaerae bacterium SM23_33]|nr:MAG: hypothetical protein AMJ81_09600 [Phycisphaerae bacterium SM23_33]